MALSMEYTSCGCNRSPFAADWGQNNLLAYCGCNAVLISKIDSPTRVITTLIGHRERVNCVRWIRNNHDAETELISGSTDKTAILWRRNNSEKFEPVAKLEGHTNAVTVATAVYIDAGGKDDLHPRLLVATASADSSVKIWERTAGKSEVDCLQTIPFGSGFVFALAWTLLPKAKVPLLACGSDDHRVHLLSEQDGKFVPVQTLLGHEDWIRGLDFTVQDNGDLMLASCAQDYYLRIWRISPRDSDTTQPGTEQQDLTPDGDIRMKETTFTVKNKDCCLCYAVSLESVLQGHDNWIYSVRWQPPIHKDGVVSQPMALLSASMDKTMILWRPDPESGMWIEQVRVGDIGGNSLGFYGGVFGPDGSTILAHGYQGAFHIWREDKETNTWLPGVTVGGHFASVQDVAWDPEGGQFVLSVSHDQTSRVHAYWKADDSEQRAWHELGRPQVHGYDVQCLALISRWRFASGADEKVVRIFDAPKNFINNFARLSGTDISKEDNLQAPEGASVPALGLSNKAVYKDSTCEVADDRELGAGSSSQYKEVYFNPLELNAPPSEDNLLQNTLWPEVQKLYGHGYEIFALASQPDKTILASACKAAKAEHAAVLLWDTLSWRQVCRLESHALTVTQLTFSHSGHLLLSVSRDRTWSIYRGRTKEQPESDPLFSRVAYTDKKTSVHTRIIWSAAWSHDDKYFVTTSRDKKAVIWAEDVSASPGESCLGNYRAVSILSDLPDSATAVDFSPVKTCDNCYLLAIGLDNGCICVYKWSENTESWTQVLLLKQSLAHHLTVRRVHFRPVVGVLGSDCDTSSSIQLASCGADNFVRVYTIDLRTLDATDGVS